MDINTIVLIVILIVMLYAISEHLKDKKSAAEKNREQTLAEKDEISIRFHDTETNDVVWYAFTRFKRASDKFDQAGVDSLIQEVLTSFN